MFSKFIENRAPTIEKAKSTAGLINESAKNMAKMVENLLEINKIEGYFNTFMTLIPDSVAILAR